MSKILVIAVYPIKKAQHGGQRRVAAIVEEYKKVFDEVKYVSVYSPDYYSDHTHDDLAIRGSLREKILQSPYTGDIICGQAIFGDDIVRKSMTRILKSFRPDIVQIEQVFPYLGLKPLLEELGMNPKIVLSSHNIEYSHKKSILDKSAFKDESESAAKIIEVCERDMAQHSQAVIAVSEGDAEELKKMGAQSVIVAPNGIAKLQLDAAAVNYWKTFKAERGVGKLAVFIGSAHPPNWHGFEKMVGDRLGFIPNDRLLVLAGSISDYFVDNYNDLKPEHITFWHRTHAAGRVSDESLSGLIHEAEVVLLPITEGGGSNLKTAEAILSGKKIVATPYAFRAFEEYLDLPNIFIADNPIDFREAIIKAFEAEYIERTKEQEALAEKVQWQYCLKPMVEEVSKL
jgi:hypothetical protein